MKTNILRFGNLMHDYCCDWKIIKNKKVNLFILKDSFVKTALKYMHNDSSTVINTSLPVNFKTISRIWWEFQPELCCASHSFTSLSELRYELFKSSTSNDLRIDGCVTAPCTAIVVCGWLGLGGALKDPSSIPSPSDWGWTVNSGGRLVPKWASDSNLDIEQHCLFTCKCKSECKRCRFANEQARCLPFCMWMQR